jgi:drug/metabolite transporter (DMT)-like permease
MTASIELVSDRRPVAYGYIAAVAAVFITAVYPALTWLSITTTLTAADLLLFRLGVSGLLFTPFLVSHAHAIPRADWLAGLPLSFLHGWGMAGCVVFGLQFAPASHAAALGPGAIAAWIALVGFIAYGVHVHIWKLTGISIIVVGVGLILVTSYRGLSEATAMVGDGMFLVASALGASYLVYIQRRRMNPVIAVALVCVTSAMIVIPWHYFFATSAIATAPLQEIVWQLLFQGVLVGCCAFFALNYATLAIGSQSVGVLSALVPVIGALCALLITHAPISAVEWTAIIVISVGVLIASIPVARQSGDSATAAGPTRRTRGCRAPSPKVAQLADAHALTIDSMPAVTQSARFAQAIAARVRRNRPSLRAAWRRP